MITCEELKSRIHYEPDTGVFVWISCKAHCINVGDIAGCTHKTSGYYLIKFDNKSYGAHRLAWLYMYGSFPQLSIDHIDGNPTNNRISNLRECTNSENMKNVGIAKNNTSGSRGVCWNKKLNKWQVHIRLDGKLHYLGLFVTQEEASEKYEKIAKENHGEFYRDLINDK